MRSIQRFLKNEEGPTAVEYSVMLAMILMSVIGAIGSVGAATGGLWSNIMTQLSGVF